MESSPHISSSSMHHSGRDSIAQTHRQDLTSRSDSLASNEPSFGLSNRNILQQFTRRRMLNWLSAISWGRIEFCEGHFQQSFNSNCQLLEPCCQWSIQQPKFYSRVAMSGAMGLAESYLRGEWSTDNLTNLLRILFRHYEKAEKFKSTISSVRRLLTRPIANAWGNTLAKSRQQIAAHYDLSNEFFEQFLDSTLMYSSAYFEDSSMSLEDASTAKLRRICDLLQLQSGDHLLEIGTGWGGFGLYCAEHHDVKLTTTTISQQQYQKAQQRFAEACIGERIELLLKDYRLLTGRFDKLVSIEMIEAVGERNLDVYFRQCCQLLKPGGRMVIQAIVMPEQRYPEYRRGVDFIQQYIFPGGFLPSISAMMEAVGRTTDFRLQLIDDLTPHYAQTLMEWRNRFTEHLKNIYALGFDDRFVRMWEYYLCYCEAAFREQSVRVVQIAWDRPLR